MHEIRVTVPEGQSRPVALLALDSGIRQVSVYNVFVHGPDQKREIVSAETSTPLAKAFIDSLLAAPWFDPEQFSLSARELRAILSSQNLREITQPMVEPALDVLEDLWQLSHLTPSYIGRACSAAILLAYGMLENSAIAIVVAALFLPFLSQVLAISFGAYAGDLGLARQGALTLGVSTAACVASGIVISLLHGGAVQFADFRGPLASLGISSVIGVAAGLASADDAGRRYLIGVAAAVQYAIFPVWLGVCVRSWISGRGNRRGAHSDLLYQRAEPSPWWHWPCTPARACGAKTSPGSGESLGRTFEIQGRNLSVRRHVSSGGSALIPAASLD